MSDAQPMTPVPNALDAGGANRLPAPMFGDRLAPFTQFFRQPAVQRALPAIALTTNQALLTAWSNDHRFDDVFARQVEALGQPGDVALGISTSGNSPNVVNALSRARALGLRTLGLTGHGGGKMAEHCDVLMAVPLTDTHSRVRSL